jgi:hypothetical protein
MDDSGGGGRAWMDGGRAWMDDSGGGGRACRAEAFAPRSSDSTDPLLRMLRPYTPPRHSTAPLSFLRPAHLIDCHIALLEGNRANLGKLIQRLRCIHGTLGLANIDITYVVFCQ